MAARNRKGEKQDLQSNSLVTRFDPQHGRWEELTPLPDARSSHDAAIVGNKLYVGDGWQLNGGTNKSTWHESLLVLDLTKAGAQWLSIPQPFQRRALAVAALNDRLYFLGGMDSSNTTSRSVDIYNTPVAVEAVKSTNHFLLVTPSPRNTACAETSFIVMSASGKPDRKPIFYARWAPSLAIAALPALNLDVVPTGKAGEVRIYFRGQPLGEVKATLRTPDEVEKELTADTEGFVHFESKQSGQHHLSIARHREPMTGFHLGKPYDMTSHNVTLTWRQP